MGRFAKVDAHHSTRRSGPSAWLVVPALALFALFALVPMVGVLCFSWVSWDGMSQMTWAGADNWESIAHNSTSINAMRLSVIVMAATWLIQTPISLLLGVFMAGRQRYREVMSVLYFLPLLFSSAAIGIAFKAMLDPNFGMSTGLGIEWLSQDWLGSEEL
ncbi:MAG: hypothetical protein LBG11_11495, partial [Bifidobacteriaceae bacterium]|nr:hypothetical protein [Bifidobacteriaceae bacterium]